MNTISCGDSVAIVGGCGRVAAIGLAAGFERNAAFSYRGKLRAAPHQRYFGIFCGDESGREMTAERTGAKDAKFHEAPRGAPNTAKPMWRQREFGSGREAQRISGIWVSRATQH